VTGHVTPQGISQALVRCEPAIVQDVSKHTYVSLRAEWSAQGQYREPESCGIQQECSRNNIECSETYPLYKERESEVAERYSRRLSVCRIESGVVGLVC